MSFSTQITKTGVEVRQFFKGRLFRVLVPQVGKGSWVCSLLLDPDPHGLFSDGEHILRWIPSDHDPLWPWGETHMAAQRLMPSQVSLPMVTLHRRGLYHLAY